MVAVYHPNLPDRYTMSKDKPNQDDDLDLFRQAVGAVKPLDTRHVPPKKNRPKPVPKQFHADEKAVMDELLSDPSDEDLLNYSGEVSWARPGVQNRVLKQLRSSRYAVQDELDLHGLTQKEARQLLLEFIQHARDNRHYCVRIIHGHGQFREERSPVLKPSVNHWLRQHSQVLAYCSAPPNRGGNGAVNVLLKK